jgi:hypothetical protein
VPDSSQRLRQDDPVREWSIVLTLCFALWGALGVMMFGGFAIMAKFVEQQERAQPVGGVIMWQERE